VLVTGAGIITGWLLTELDELLALTDAPLFPEGMVTSRKGVLWVATDEAALVGTAVGATDVVLAGMVVVAGTVFKLFCA